MSSQQPFHSANNSNNTTIPWDSIGEIILDPSLTTRTTNPTTNQTQKSIKELFYNGTGFYIEDEVDPGLNDLQTLVLACFATLVPLIVTLATAFGIRFLWKRYKRRTESNGGKCDGLLNRRRTSDSNDRPLHSHLLNSDKQCSTTGTETHLAINTSDEVEVCDGSTGVGNLIRSSNNHSSTNGSIITMTLKNNHLIVETEERNDIEEDSRETTMKYSPGARDGVFVVEVQQGVRRSPGSGGPTSDQTAERSSVSVSDQCALVHNPPDRYSDDETLEECDDDYVETTSPTTADTPENQHRNELNPVRTGLAQSNTSLTSHHQSYCYTNQQCYDNGSYGYQVYNGYVNDEPAPVKRSVDDNKPRITSATFKVVNKRSENDEEKEGNSMNNANTSNSVVGQDFRSAEYENRGFDNIDRNLEDDL